MKRIISALVVLLAAVFANAQTIISHTTVIAKFGADYIEKVAYTNNKESYNAWLHKEDNKIITSIKLSFASKDDVVKCLSYLYKFDKGDGYLIDLETVNGNTAYSLGKTYVVKGEGQVGEVYVNRYTIGKLLNALGVSVYPNGKPAETNDDLYNNGKSLF